MATSVVMPALEMAQEAGKLVKWYKQEGDAVAKGDLLMAVETDKAVVEIEADAGGTLSGIRTKEGDVVAVGQVIAWLLAPGEKAPEESSQPVSGRQATGDAKPAAVSAAPVKVEPQAERQLLSPKARRLAAEQAAKAGGAVPAATADSARPQPGQVWAIMAQRVTASWTTVPHFFLTRDIDATAMVAARAASAPADAITHTDLLVSCVARSLKSHPGVNASWNDGAIEKHAAINVGIATAVDGGLIVPVIHGADTLSIPEIARRRRDLVEKAKAGRIQPADLAGGTITISNLGMYGIDAFSAIVNAPQAAILAVGRIADRIVARGGHAVVCPQMTVTLSCDHRVVDGARAAEFLRDLAGALEAASVAS